MAALQTLGWVQDAVFYQIFPDRFARSRRAARLCNLEPWDSPPTIYGFKGGDLLGAGEKLDYLQDLGVTAVYFTPIFTSAANHRYHTIDYFSVDPILGGNAAFAEFLKQAHGRGIRVVLDGVFNHTGRGFYQFNHTLENGSASPYLDWFIFDRKRLRPASGLNAYPRRPGEDLGYHSWRCYPALPKIDVRTPAVREFILSVAEHWVRFGIDGWRLDVPAEIDDDAFWQEFRHRVKAVNPETYIVGEIWDEAGRWLQGDQFDAVMNYLFTKAALAGLCDHLDLDLAHRTGSDYRKIRPLSLPAFSEDLDSMLRLYDPVVTRSQLNLLDSHDTPRFLTLAGGDETALRLAATLMFAFPGAPCVYYGDEIGMEGSCDPDCRRAFPWDRRRWNHGLRDFFKRLIRLRRSSPALRRGGFERLHGSDGVYALRRKLGREEVVVVLNLSRRSRNFSLDLPGAKHSRAATWREAWSRRIRRSQQGRLAGLSLRPRDSLILQREP